MTSSEQTDLSLGKEKQKGVVRQLSFNKDEQQYTANRSEP